MIAETIGQLAALGASFFWSLSSVFFTLSGRRVGSPVVNRTRLLFAVVFVVLTHRLLQGTFLPADADGYRWFWMGLSGFIGYVIGDGFLFQGFVLIGPRLSMLLMALAPVFSTIMAWLLLDEQLSPVELVAIGLTVGGIMIVVADRQNGNSSAVLVTSRRGYLIGVLCGLGAAMGQAGGMLASRIGLEGGYPALSGNLIRVVVAAAAIWLIALPGGQAQGTFRLLRQKPDALRYIAAGSFVGPFVGVWLALLAVQNAPLGVATTLTSLMPIFLLPISRVLFKDKITKRAILGTVVAVIGTALLFL